MTQTNPALAKSIVENVTAALREDVGSGDVTAQLIPPDRISEAIILSRENAVVCGIPWVNEVFQQLDPTIVIDWLVRDGDEISTDQTLCKLSGNSRNILTGERTALNFLQLLSGTATLSRHYAILVAKCDTKILDTRKTVPGLRVAQKYAIAVGGCHNHRMGLYDAFLIKENHIAACGGITAAIEAARTQAPGLAIEIEVENLTEFQEALAAEPNTIMLDNFSIEDIKKACEVRGSKNVKLEVSGNITEQSIVQYALPGVDFISSGQLTKHCRAIDLSLLIRH